MSIDSERSEARARRDRAIGRCLDAIKEISHLQREMRFQNALLRDASLTEAEHIAQLEAYEACGR